MQTQAICDAGQNNQYDQRGLQERAFYFFKDKPTDHKYRRQDKEDLAKIIV